MEAHEYGKQVHKDHATLTNEILRLYTKKKAYKVNELAYITGQKPNQVRNVLNQIAVQKRLSGSKFRADYVWELKEGYLLSHEEDDTSM